MTDGSYLVLPAPIFEGLWKLGRRRLRPLVVGLDHLDKAGGKNFGCGIHALMLVEKGTNIARKLPVVRLPCSVQRIGGLLIGAAYLLPADCSDGDERRQLILTPRNRDGLFVSATV